MDDYLAEMVKLLWTYLPNLIGALLILIGGWIFALAVAAMVRSALKRTAVENKLAAWFLGEDRVPGDSAERGISRIVYYLILVLVLVAFFQALGLTLATQSLNELLTQVLQYVPRLVGAGILLLVALGVATGFKRFLLKVLSGTALERKLQNAMGPDEKSGHQLMKFMADVIYWLVFLLFIPAVMGALGLEGLLQPVRRMVEQFLVYLPNVFAAVLILIVGWLGARIIQRLLTNLLAAAGADAFSERMGIQRLLGGNKLSATLGIISYALILIPVLIASLNAAQMEAITMPASNMLSIVLSAVPRVFAAALLLLTAYIVGLALSNLVGKVLDSLGFNNLFSRLGLGEAVKELKETPAQWAGFIALMFTMLFGVMEAAHLLGFTGLAGLVVQFTRFGGKIILGLVILGVGIWISDLAANTLKRSRKAHAGLVSSAARIAILVLVISVALGEMGLADEIIGLAFGLTLGSAAVAAAIAFGIGGRDVAARKLEEWTGSADNRTSSD